MPPVAFTVAAPGGGCIRHNHDTVIRSHYGPQPSILSPRHRGNADCRYFQPPPLSRATAANHSVGTIDCLIQQVRIHIAGGQCFGKAKIRPNSGKCDPCVVQNGSTLWLHGGHILALAKTLQVGIKRQLASVWMPPDLGAASIIIHTPQGVG
jgi:hypothetical protein